MMGQYSKSSTEQRFFCRLANQTSTTPLAHVNETSEHLIFRLNSSPLLYLLSFLPSMRPSKSINIHVHKAGNSLSHM